MRGKLWGIKRNSTIFISTTISNSVKQKVQNIKKKSGRSRDVSPIIGIACILLMLYFYSNVSSDTQYIFNVFLIAIIIIYVIYAIVTFRRLKDDLAKKDRRPLTWYECIVGIALFILIKYLSQRILSYPRYIFYSLWLVIFIIYAIVDFRRSKDDLTSEGPKDEPGLLPVLSKLIKCAVWSLLINALLFVPFNYAILLFAKNSTPENYTCEITNAVNRVSRRGTGRRVHLPHKEILFKFNSKEELEDYNEPIISELAKDKGYKDYNVIITVRRSILGAYVLDYYSVIHK